MGQLGSHFRCGWVIGKVGPLSLELGALGKVVDPPLANVSLNCGMSCISFDSERFYLIPGYPCILQFSFHQWRYDFCSNTVSFSLLKHPCSSLHFTIDSDLFWGRHADLQGKSIIYLPRFVRACMPKPSTFYWRNTTGKNLLRVVVGQDD